MGNDERVTRNAIFASLTAALGIGVLVESSSFAAPLAAYSLDTGTGTSVNDASGNGHTGTLVNGPSWSAGKYNGGLAFDGVNDYATLGDVAQADSLTAITVSTWVKFATGGSGANETHLVDKSQCNGVTNGGPWELGVGLFASHKAEFVIYPQNGKTGAFVVSGSGTTSIDDGAWHYVTGRYDGTNISVWVDGSLESSRAARALTMSNTAAAIEFGGRCNGVSAYPFKGTLDDVRIYNRALTSSEILADMATPVAGGTTAPPPADTAAPSPPMGLTTSGVTTSQVTLAWQASTDNVGVAGYRVYRDGALIGTTSSTSITNTGLAANTRYVYTVAAFDVAANTSAQSASRSVTTASPPTPPADQQSSDTVAPTTPTGLSATGVTSSQITLSWQASTDNVGVSGYRVYRSGTLAGSTSSTTFTDNGLTASTTYAYTVAAFDQAGSTSAQSVPRSVTTSAAASTGSTPLAAYSLDTGTGTSVNDASGNGHTGTLVNGPSWSAGKYNGGLAFDGVNDYATLGDVAQADSLTAITVSTWVKFATGGSGANETHLVDKSQCNGVTNGGPWELGVGLFASHKAEFVIYPQNGKTGAFVVSGSGTTSIDDGAWHYVTGRYDGTNISVWVDGSLESSRAARALTMSNTAAAIEFGGRCNGVSAYPFKGTLDDVRIYNRALTSSEILADMATPVAGGTTAPPPADTAAPSPPMGLTTSGVTTSQVTLAWQASTDNVGVAGYRVYRDGALIGTTSSTSITNTGLAANTRYVYTVAAFDAAANTSAQSASRSVTTASPSGGGSGTYSTSFDATENPLSEGGNWIDGKVVGIDWNNPQSVSGSAFASVRSGATGNRYDDSIAHLSTSVAAFMPNQYAQGTVYRAPGYAPSGSKHEIELLLRFDISPHSARGYEILWGWDGDFAIVRWNGALGDYTALYSATMPQLADGDVVRAEISGSVIRVYRNGSLVATGPSNTTWTSGQPGVGFWPVDSTIPTNYGWKNYEAGNL